MPPLGFIPYLYCMNKDLIFFICTGLALIGWMLLIFAPRWKYTEKLVLSGGISLLIGGIYAGVLATTMGDGGAGNFFTFEGVKSIFQNETVVLVGWIHYLSFDLFIGAWEVQDAQEKGVKHGLLIPCLILTCMYGPVGLLCYYLVRRFAPGRTQ